MVGAYAAYVVMVDLGGNYWFAMAVAAMVVAVLAVLCERLVFNPLRDAVPIYDMIAAIGIMMFLEAVVQMHWGAEFRRLPTPYTEILSYGGLIIPAQRLLIIGGAFTLMLGLHLFLKKTMTGSTIVAMAQNREGASLVGINATRVAMLYFAISDVLTDVGSALVELLRHVLRALNW